MTALETKMPQSSFVTSILATAGRLDKEDLNAKLNQLSRKTGEMKAEVYDALHKNYAEFFPNFDSINLVSKKVGEFQKEMEEISVSIENQLKAQMQLSSTENDKLFANWLETLAVLDLLGQLIKIHGGILSASKDVNAKCFLRAATQLSEIEKMMTSLVAVFNESVKVLPHLQARHLTLKEQLVHDVQKIWAESFHWKMVKDDAFGAMVDEVIELSLVCSSESKNRMDDVIKTMDVIGTLDAHLKTFGDKLFIFFLKPLITVPGVRTDFTADLAWSRIKITKPNANAKDVAVQIPDAQHMMNDIESIFSILDQCLGHYSTAGSSQDEGSPRNGNPGGCLMARLGRQLADDFVEMVISECLSKAVPTSHVDLKGFQEVVVATEALHQKLTAMKFLDSSKLVDYVNNIDLVFANKKCQEILVRARDLMKSEIHNEVFVSSGDSEEKDLKLNLGREDLSKDGAKEKIAELMDSKLSPLFRFPTCKISSCAYELVKLAYKMLDEAVTSVRAGTEEGENVAPTSAAKQCAIQLFYGVRNMFELYCNVYPVTHKKLLRTVPPSAEDPAAELCNRLVAVHHNDCMYFAHHLNLLGHQYRPLLPEPLCHGAATFVDLIPVFRRLGARNFMEMLTQQKMILIGYLGDDHVYANIAEGDNFEKTDRAIHKLILKLRHLVDVWKDVLPVNVYNKSVGTLLNCVLAEILARISSLEDISETDAKFLNSILQFISKSGSDLFHDSASGSVFKFVPKWNKMEEMKFLLTARLQEIVDRWADGKGPLAAEFPSAELKQLVRALFQNTEKRAAALASIK